MSPNVTRRFTLLAMLAAGALMVGCETLQPEAVKVQTQGKSIAVASLLDPKLKLQWIGTTVFNNEYGEVSPDGWKLDEHAQAVAVDALRATSRYAQVTGVSGAQRVADGAPRLPEGQRADFVVTIVDAGQGDPLFGTNQNISGTGVVQRTFMGLSRTEVFSAVRIEIYDGAGKSLGGRTQFAHVPAGFSLQSGKGSASEAPKVADADMAALREKLQARVREAVEAALASTGLR